MKDQLLFAIKQAFIQAKEVCEKNEIPSDIEKSLGLKHSDRSRLWIHHLAQQLLTFTQNNRPETEEYLAFYQAHKEARQLFGLNEFLFDIVIGKMTNIETASGFRNSQSNYDTLKAINCAM